MTEVDDDTLEWWVLGTPGQFCGVPGCRYVHWKGDAISGCYVETSDPEDAERFDTKDEALAEIASDLVRKEFDGARGKIIPLKVTKTVKVSADL